MFEFNGWITVQEQPYCVEEDEKIYEIYEEIKFLKGAKSIPGRGIETPQACLINI